MMDHSWSFDDRIRTISVPEIVPDLKGWCAGIVTPADICKEVTNLAPLMSGLTVKGSCYALSWIFVS